MDTPEPSVEFEQAWIQLSRVISNATTLKEIAELFFLKGRCAGMDAGMRHFAPDKTLSPEDAAKLASVTISETFDHELYGRVLEAQKQIS